MSTRLRLLVVRGISVVAIVVLHAARTRAVVAPPVLSPPQVAGTTVTLSWTVPFGTTGIRVEAGTSPGLSNVANSVLGAVSGYTATSVPNGVYYVRIRAIDPTGESAPSNEIAVVVGGGGAPGCTTAPNPPALGTALISGLSVTLSWTPSSSGCPATTFTIQAGSQPGSSNVAVVNVGPAISVTASPPSGMYFVRVLAQNAFGTSAVSNEVVFETGLVPTGPPPPNAGGVCQAPVPGTITGCWLGLVSNGDGLASPPGYCTGERYNIQFNLRQRTDGTVAGSYSSQLVVASSACPPPLHRVGQIETIPIIGTVVGNTFRSDFPFAFAAPATSPFTLTFTNSRITGSFTLNSAGVTGPGALAANRQ